MRLAILQATCQCCTVGLDREHVSVPSHSSLRVSTPSVSNVIFVTAISEVVVWMCVTQSRTENFEQSCAIKFCVKLRESASVTFEKLRQAYGIHSLSRDQVFLWNKLFLEGRKTR
ncbi:hypothetical protein TNIN_452471 [Trichonephila inaurata madagascariensis]|uniref:Transposase n=1 Tax=Trichonephila inaurata madagascariensis TaxID=2747483 RepID=A0A8X6MJJ8_9ARAC|nr:hypothetical protein TNIN_452471 [Trichonephila inaurata madagascariensis]